MDQDIDGPDFHDFVVRIERDNDGGYRSLAQGPSGEGKSKVVLPFDEKDLKIFLLEVGQRLRPSNSRAGRVPEPMQQTKEFGSKLFDSVFSGEIRDVFIQARRDAERGGYGLRVQLRLTDVPELADLPWEFLFDGRDFLSLTGTTPLVRYFDLPNPPRPMMVRLPMRILVTISSPHNLPPLDVEAERAKVEKALGPLRDRGVIELDYTPDATISTLQRTLSQAKAQKRPYHVWHYIGHGAFDPNVGASVLLFCDDSSMAQVIDGFQLGTMFNSYPDTRLVLLNACEGARSDREDPFAGVATALVERAIPAVIAMQFEISDGAAITFAEGFYSSIVDGLPVDAALTEARRAVFFMPNWVEWATPVLFMRVRDGRLFNMQFSEAPLPIPRPPTAVKETPVKAEKTNIVQRPENLPPPPPVVQVLQGPLEGSEFKVDQDEMTFGRADSNTVIFDGQFVSRRHAAIRKQGTAYWLSDEGSSNGTELNDEAVTESVELKHGDRIQIGETVIQFSHPASVAKSAMPAQPAQMRSVVPSAPIQPAPAQGQQVIGPSLFDKFKKQVSQQIQSAQENSAQQSVAPVSGDAQTPGREYEVPAFQSADLAERLQQWFRLKGYDTQQIPFEGRLIVQGRKGDRLTDVLGMSTAATIIVDPAPNGFKASVGGGKWLDKAAVAAFGMFVALGFTVFTAGFGAYQQKQLESSLWLIIDQYVHSMGGSQVMIAPPQTM